MPILSASDPSSPSPTGLVDRLLDEFALQQVARDACLRAGVGDREEQVAYCLAALVQKHEWAGDSSRGPDRRFERLHLRRADFAEVLAWWADEVAAHVRQWGSAYEAIHAEADRGELRTLFSLMRVSRAEAFHVETADHLAGIVLNAPSLAEMSLALARAVPPRPNDYVFQSPLPGWITLSALRKAAWDPEPLDDVAVGPPDVAEQGQSWLAAVRDIARRIAELAETRTLLTDAIAQARGFEAYLARRTPGDPEAEGMLAGIRAELQHDVDVLVRAQRALPAMLAYLTLALRDGAKSQGIAILSLRGRHLDGELRHHLTASMRAIAEDGDQPTAGLIVRVRAAGTAVPGARVTALEALRDRPARRGTEVAPVLRRLEELPPVVADVAAIGAAVGSSPSAAATTRGTIVKELRAVDAWAGWVFARYARMPS